MRAVSIVIVNYNTSEILKKCLENLLSIDPNLEVVVIDNNSTDGSVEMLRKNFPTIKVEALLENKGLSVAHNRGLELTTKKYILYLGSDAFPTRETLDGMINYFEENPSVGAATAKLELRDGSLDMDAHRGFPTPWTSFCHFSGLEKIFKGTKMFDRYFMGYENLDVPHEIDLCISHFLFVRREVFNKVGKWDEDFFVFGEDVDMCYRIKSAGFKIMYLPQFKALHYKGVSVGIRKESKDITKATLETKKMLTRSTTRAMAMFYNKHLAAKYPKLVNFLVLTGIKILEKQRLKKFA